jgi:2-iminobutanoate/2-iminopropanoate deaminase
MTTNRGRVRRISVVPGLPAPVGPFSPAVVAGGLVYVSGQVPGTGDDAGLDFAAQVRTELANLESSLVAAGSGRHHVVKVNAYLTAAEQLAPFNAIYAEFFGGDLPARTTVMVAGLWRVLLEIDCIAVCIDPQEQS